MNNFSKFLKKGEDLKKVFYCKSSPVRIYFIILLFIPLFFMLFPMFKVGWQGLSLWLFSLVFLVFWLSKEINEQKNIYLLTNKRIVHIKSISKDNFRETSFIKLINIEKVQKQNLDIIVYSKRKKFYLSKVILVEELYSYLDSYINKQNLV